MSSSSQTQLKTALITGANSGIGRVTAIELARRGYHVVLACRSMSNTTPVLEEIKALGAGSAEFIELELGDFESVRHCAATFLKLDRPLHLLVLNAGLAGRKGLTRSGFELTFGVCHMGHFLLTHLLLDKLKASRPSRVVAVSSKLHSRVRGIDFSSLRSPTSSVGGVKEYAVAKLANLLFIRELARRLEGTGVSTYALHPGIVATNVWRSLPWPIDAVVKRFMITESQGARTTIFCATELSLAHESGHYYENSRRSASSAAGSNPELARRLWIESERWIAQAGATT